jgi:hypothetical protein
MGPLAFANWGEINRLFCACLWLVALGLSIAIVGHFAGAGSACARLASSHPSPCAAGGSPGQARAR